MKNKIENNLMTVIDNNNKFSFKRFKIKIVEGCDIDNSLFTIDEALNIADENNLDLVIIKQGFYNNGKEFPAIAKLMNYSKFLYNKKKKEKELAKKQRENTQKTKCIKFHIGIDDGDYNYKLNHIKDFLNDGNKVFCQIVLRGREKYSNTIADEFILKLTNDCNEFANFTKPFSRQGSFISAFLIKKEIK